MSQSLKKENNTKKWKMDPYFYICNKTIKFIEENTWMDEINNLGFGNGTLDTLLKKKISI